MPSHSLLKLVLASSTALAALAAGAAWAAPTQILTPNIIATAGATSTTMNGVTFTNQGLQGVARIPAGTKDFNGDTLGAFSSLDVKPGTWHRNADGTYGGVLYGLPDRGPNGAGSVSFSDYQGRVNTYTMAFTPYTGTATVSANANALSLTQNGGFLFKDFNGNVTTGLDPGAPGPNAYVTENGMNLPGSKLGAAAGKISLDAEGIRFLQNGNFYVGDEYGAEVYYFNAAGQMLGVVQPPAALVPRTNASSTDPSTLSFTSQADALVGRRVNQGIEGMAVTPDQKHLVTLLQSGAMQDTAGGAANRTNTRLMIYDISSTPTPTSPVADYVLQLPVYNSTGSGAAANATAAQSELLALNDTQFLVLSRDGNGLGQSNNPFVYKSVLLVDVAGATNNAGNALETSYAPLASAGVLNSSITPVQQTQLVNLLNSTQLAKFGINLNNAVGQANSTTLTEKWEGMSLVPALEEGAPQDYFLLIGNDNDFLASNCSFAGSSACAQSVNSDAMVLTYRLTLPTYVDPGFLNSMITSGPVSLGMNEMAAHDLALSGDLGQHLRDVRHGGMQPAQLAGLPLAVWAGGSYVSRGESSRTSDLSMGGGTVGVDAQVSGSVSLGMAAGYYSGNSSATGGYHVDPSAFQLSAYGFWNQGNMHASLGGTWSSQHFGNITRPGAYGMTASGKTDGTGYSVSGEFGFDIDADLFRLTPVVGFHWLDLDLDGYTETGAAGGNVIMPHLHDSGVYGYAGAEATLDFEAFTALLRVTYNTEDVYKTGAATFILANAGNVMGTQTVALSGLGQGHVEPSISIAGSGPLNWSLSYGARLGVNDGTEHHIMASAKLPL